MDESVPMAGETVWKVDRWSPNGSVIPVITIVLGAAALVFGLWGIAFPWQGNSRWSFIWAIAWAVACASLGIRRLYLAARSVRLAPDGTFTFVSRRTALVVAPGDLISISSEVPLDWTSFYLCRAYAREGTILVNQRLRRAGRSPADAQREAARSSLVAALVSANPQAILDKGFTQGVGGGPFGS